MIVKEKEPAMRTRVFTETHHNFGARSAVPGLLLVALAVFLPGVSLAATPATPYIQEVSPPSAIPPAAMDVTLTITGTNFSDGTLAPLLGTLLSNVQFGSLTITTPAPVLASCSSGICTQLQVTIPKASIATGTVEVKVLNPFNPLNGRSVHRSAASENRSDPLPQESIQEITGPCRFGIAEDLASQ
jgi:hypothetical protein